MHHATLLGLLAAAAGTAAARPPHRARQSNGTVQCPIVFDGRVAATTELTDFDSYATSPFNAEYVKGDGLKWSEIIKFPEVPNARFDDETHKALEVTISDDSIFQNQQGFRRAGLQFQGDTNNGSPASEGVKTIHFSVRYDAQRALNLSHEYLAVWHETADYSANQFNFEVGTVIGQENSLPADTYKVLDRHYQQIWATPILEDEWQNFAITLDFDKKCVLAFYSVFSFLVPQLTHTCSTLQVYYSAGDEPLESVTDAVSNDNSGEGQYQIGLLKKPTGTDDVVNSGYQESGIDEGLIYGSLFIEDSADGCVSL